MDLGLSGKVVVVTGGASNIGRAISLRFGREGAETVILDIDEAQGERTGADVRAEGGRAHVFRVDATDKTIVAEAVAEVRGRLGRIDVLVNNIGWSGRLGFFLNIEPERWDKAYRLNLLPTLIMTRAVLPAMMEQRSGAIVSIASDAGFGMQHVSDYGAMKAGVMAFSRSIAAEYGGFGVRSNIVAPGLVMPRPEDIGTGSFWNEGIGYGEKELAQVKEHAPLKMLPSADDIAASVVFLASAPARALTGQVISVSGGYQMPR